MKKSAFSEGATRITPSAPIPNRRSHRRRASSSPSSNRPATSSSRTKSLPVPWYFQNRSSSIRGLPGLRQIRDDFLGERLGRGPPRAHPALTQTRPHAPGDRLGSAPPRLEPADPRIPPEEGELPARERPRALHRARDRRVERELADEVTGQLSVPDGLARSEPGTEPALDEPAHLVEPPTFDHLGDSTLAR